MKVIAQRLYNEPSVFIGAVVTLALLALAFLTGTDWDASVIAGIVAPLASSLGIRQLVTPADAKTAPLPPTATEERTDG